MSVIAPPPNHHPQPTSLLLSFHSPSLLPSWAIMTVAMNCHGSPTSSIDFLLFLLFLFSLNWKRPNPHPSLYFRTTGRPLYPYSWTTFESSDHHRHRQTTIVVIVSDQFIPFCFLFLFLITLVTKTRIFFTYVITFRSINHWSCPILKFSTFSMLKQE